MNNRRRPNLPLRPEWWVRVAAGLLLFVLSGCTQEVTGDAQLSSTSQPLGNMSALAGDNFNRADGTLGSAWKALASTPRIVSQQVQEANSPDGNDAVAIYDAVSWPADQYSQVRIRATNQYAGCSPIVRARDSSTIEMYFVYVVGPLGSGAQVVLAKFLQHNYSEIWSGVATVNADDVLFLGVEGSTLTVKLNGTTLVTRSDASIDSGFAGFDLTDYGPPGSAGSGRCDDWEGGALLNGLAAPANLTGAAASWSEVSLSWTASAQAAGYQVFRDGTQVGTTASTSFNDAGLALGTTYSYAVSAIDVSGNASALSASIDVTTLGDTSAPSTPGNVAATSTSPTQVNLTWSASSDNVGVASYSIARNGSVIGNTTSLSFADGGLSPSTTYSYTVAALDAVGNPSPASSAISVTTQAASDTTAPSVPGSLSVSALSSTQIRVAWTPATDNVGVAGYLIYRDGDLLAQVATTEFSDTGLMPGTSYGYSVAALDAAGNVSATSAVQAATTHAGTASSILASDGFNRPDGGPGAGWTVIDSDPRIINGHVQEATAADGWDSIMIYTGLSWPDDQYTQVTVKGASANAGCSAIVRVKNDPVIEMYFVYVVGPLGPGAELVLAKFVEHNYTELWRGVQTINSGDKLYLSAVGTTLTVKLNGNTLTTQHDNSIARGFSGVDVTDYGGGAPGEGQCDDWEGGAVGAAGVPVPTNLAAVAQSSSQVALSWSASARAVGYGVFRNGTQITTSLTPSFNDSGLSLGTSYSYAVTAYDDAGNSSAPSNVVSVVTLGDTTPPSVPANLVGSALSWSQIGLTWTAAADDVGVVGYQLLRNGSPIGTATTTSFTDSGLAPATTYTYNVLALDGAGNPSSPSSTATVTTQATGSSPVETMLANDHFNRANGSLNAGWTVIDSEPRIVNQSVQETNPSDGNDAIAIYTGLSWPADQYTRLTITAATANAGCAAIVRAQNDPNIEMYFVYVIGPLGPSATLVLAKFVQHNYTELWSGTLNIQAGDSLYLSAVGSTLTVKLNGAILAIEQDTSIVAGYSGFDVTDYGSGGPGQGGCDDWEGGLAVAQ